MRAQPSPRECSGVGNRKLIRFSWGLCQPSPSPEDKALHRDGVSFTPLTDQSRKEGGGALSPGWEPHEYRTEPVTRDSEHDARGVCDKYVK